MRTPNPIPRYAAIAAALLATLWLAPGPAQQADRDPAMEQAVIAAVRLAYGLERAYWEAPARWPTWDRLEAHYRQGFSSDLAQAMTDYSMGGDADPATWVPDKVHVASIDGDTATVWFPTPTDFGRDSAWGLEAYMVLRLRREADGRWVVYWGTDSASPP